MILNRSFYNKVSYFRAQWNFHQIRNISGEKIFKALGLFKTEWPSKIYFYSPRLKRKPHFTGDIKALKEWKSARVCEAVCPTQAIKVTETDFIIDQKGCIACGLCVELAPKGVLELGKRPEASENL